MHNLGTSKENKKVAYTANIYSGNWDTKRKLGTIEGTRGNKNQIFLSFQSILGHMYCEIMIRSRKTKIPFISNLKKPSCASNKTVFFWIKHGCGSKPAMWPPVWQLCLLKIYLGRPNSRSILGNKIQSNHRVRA